MEYNWNQIKETIKLNCEHAFSESSLIVTEEDLDTAITIFKNVMLYPMPGCDNLRGLESSLLEAIYNVCMQADGVHSYLDTLTTDFEPFFKKVLILQGDHLYGNLLDRSWMFEALFKELSVAPVFYGAGHKLGSILEADIENYRADAEGIYIVRKAQICRNDIHNSKNLDTQQIGAAMKYSFATYVWTILKKKSALLANIPDLSRESVKISADEQDDRYIYDFLSFGKTANEVKNQIINSYILNRIYTCYPNNKRVCELEADVLAFSRNSLNADATKRFLSKLETAQRVRFANVGKTEVYLTEAERNRLQSISDQYTQAISSLRNTIKAEIDAIRSEYSLDALVKAFSDFLDDNFSRDINIESDDTSNTYSNYQNLIALIEAQGFSRIEAEKVYKIIVTASKDNKVLYKLSLGRVVSKLNNNNTQIDAKHGLKNEVYLDTQIVLYMLCLSDELPKPTVGTFAIARHVLETRKRNSNISLRFPRVYINEVANHLRKAVNIIMLTRNNGVDGMQLSNNVFYKYYCDLKYENNLPEEVDSFESYMDHFFCVGLNDLNKDFSGIAKSVISDILKEDHNVELFSEIPFYSEDELKTASQIIQDVIKANDLEIKEGNRLKADSIIGRYLFEGNFDKEPFFLTYDRSFKFFKEEYSELYKRKRQSSVIWHLLTPSQFVNHVDLMNLKIDETRLSNELLSLIESEDYELKTHTLIDDLCRFIDVPGVDPDHREKGLKDIMKKVIGEGEFSRQIETITIHESQSVKNFCELSNDVFSHYLEQGGELLLKYAAIFADNHRRSALIDTIIKYADDIRNVNKDQLFSEIAGLLDAESNIS